MSEQFDEKYGPNFSNTANRKSLSPEYIAAYRQVDNAHHLGWAKPEEAETIATQLHDTLFKAYTENGGKLLGNKPLFDLRGNAVRISGLADLNVLKEVLKDSPEAQEILKKSGINLRADWYKPLQITR
jgi:hypothetical protein